MLVTYRVHVLSLMMIRLVTVEDTAQLPIPLYI